MTDPTVRSLGDARVAAAFGRPGCPICGHAGDAVATWLESILRESVNDVGFRAEFDDARGFCRRHSRQVLDADRARSGGGVAAAILYAATLRVRDREVRAASDARGRSRRSRLDAARRPPDCPACRETWRAERDALRSVVGLAADPGWVARIAATPFCLDHLLALMAERDLPASWPTVEEAQLARVEALRGRLDRFIHDSSHDRRHLLTDEDRRSVDAAADLLAGDAGDAGGAGRA